MASFTVNGHPVTVEKNQKLIRYLRDTLHLTSVKDGCSEGACGTCHVLIDGKPTKACVPQTEKLEGKTIVTVEGLQSDTTPPAFLTSYDGEDFILDIVMPDTITYLDYGTEFIYDRSTMYNSEYAVQWLLEFDLQEEQNGTMVYTGEVVAVDLTDVLY